MNNLRRRTWLECVGSAAFIAAVNRHGLAVSSADSFMFRYMLASPMYGYAPLAEILPEAQKIGATAIDIWPKVHGNQREQVTEMGEAQFAGLLREYNLTLGCITQYPLGPFGLKEEISFAKRLGCPLIVTGGEGPKGLRGNELKHAVKAFVEKMKPHLDIAASGGVTLAIENHANNLIESEDSLRYLIEYRPSEHLAVALAPYHLPQDSELLAKLIRELGDGIALFYAWQHGAGCMKQQPKAQELLQMPGRGNLDFGPIVKALRDIRYSGWTEIFMHPFPRGIPILETTSEVTVEINRARGYLESVLV